MLGHWKDYDELESSLSMPELTATLKAMYKTENRKNKFLAKLQGIDIDEDSESGGNPEDRPVTFSEIQARAIAKVTNNQTQARAAEFGFTSDIGVGYEYYGGDD
jgi:hypothetical protein